MEKVMNRAEKLQTNRRGEKSRNQSPTHLFIKTSASGETVVSGI